MKNRKGLKWFLWTVESLPESVPAYVTAKFERCIKDSAIQESTLRKIPVPENVEEPKVMEHSFKRIVPGIQEK